MMGKILAAALVVVALALVVTAHAEEATGFRDVPWGASEDTLRFRVPLDYCNAADPHSEYGTRRCRARSDITFGDVRPTSVFFFLRDNMLVGWQIAYPPRFRVTMANALTKKYGEPTKVYEGDRVAWKGRTAEADFVGGRAQDLVPGVAKAAPAPWRAEPHGPARTAAEGIQAAG